MSHGVLDVERLRADFPILQQEVSGQPLVYLDNAASTHMPRPVIEAIRRYHETDHANVHRAVHELGRRATDAYERARARVQRFLNAERPEEIVFVRGTTEAINLVAHSFVGPRLQPGDEVLITALEHHSNLVPWQMLCSARGARLVIAPVDDRGELELASFKRLLGPRTKLVAFAHVSNALGTINPVRAMIGLARDVGVPTLVDGAQSAGHLPVDVRDLDCDFYACSGHKLYGPTGIGVLYGRYALLSSMVPWQGGGEMIRSVSFETTTFNDAPWRFEAGTPNIAGAIGLAAAIDYVEGLGRRRIAAHEEALTASAVRMLESLSGLQIVGAASERSAIISFVSADLDAHDLGILLDQQGIAVRAGFHCAQPLIERLGHPATLRASFGLYNTHDDVDRFAQALRAATESP